MINVKIVPFFVTIIFLIYCTNLFASDNRKNLINLSYSNTPYEVDPGRHKDNMLNLQLDFNRNVTNFLGVGGYVGTGLYQEWRITVRDGNSRSYISTSYGNSVQYGINGKLHLLPLIIHDVTNPRIDLYVSGNLGIIQLNSKLDETNVPKRGAYFDTSLMGGASFYLVKTFGLFAEAGYKKYEYFSGFHAKYGLTVRF